MNAKTLGWLLGVIRVQQYVGKLEKMKEEEKREYTSSSLQTYQEKHPLL